LRSVLHIDETRNLRKEKVQKELSPTPKKLEKELKKKKKQNPRKKEEADVKLDKDGFPIYDQSLFSSFEAPEWLDAEQECCLGPTSCINYGGRVTQSAFYTLSHFTPSVMLHCKSVDTLSHYSFILHFKSFHTLTHFIT
jgi:hypothetical protein